MSAKLVTYNSQNNAGTLGSGLLDWTIGLRYFLLWTSFCVFLEKPMIIDSIVVAYGSVFSNALIVI